MPNNEKKFVSCTIQWRNDMRRAQIINLLPLFDKPDVKAEDTWAARLELATGIDRYQFIPRCTDMYYPCQLGWFQFDPSLFYPSRKIVTGIKKNSQSKTYWIIEEIHLIHKRPTEDLSCGFILFERTTYE